MANLFGKVKDFMFGDYDDDYEDDEFEEYDEEPVKELPAKTSARVSDYPDVPKSRNRKDSQVVSINTSVQMQVVIIKPEAYEDAQDICDQIKEKKPVVVNLEKVEYPVAQRIMDFLSGTCYSLDGTIQRVASNIFVIAPANVDISGNLKEELKTKGIILPWVSNASKQQ